ncbi:nitrate/nitrite transporter NrtS [Streptomyces sp. NRRL S-646]|uniref:nitrate/nitrite transporter NrtS n=1 Tax=Streptomyces sp. NRRL S-646 TaxID=1463917 RepID=UPI00099B3AC6|nr:nitrate/nitrite transporter NrtS [Streptomyces sp. NRRL S-646]
MSAGHETPRSAGEAPRLLATVFSAASLSRCVPIALLVGTLLSLVNQGAVIASGDATAATWLRVLFNYLVPFCVSSAGFFSCRRAAWRTVRPSRARSSWTR